MINSSKNYHNRLPSENVFNSNNILSKKNNENNIIFNKNENNNFFSDNLNAEDIEYEELKNLYMNNLKKNIYKDENTSNKQYINSNNMPNLIMQKEYNENIENKNMNFPNNYEYNTNYLSNELQYDEFNQNNFDQNNLNNNEQINISNNINSMDPSVIYNQYNNLNDLKNLNKINNFGNIQNNNQGNNKSNNNEKSKEKGNYNCIF